MRKVLTTSDDRRTWVAYLYTLSLPVTVSIREGSDRSTEQNSKLWPMLTDVANQVDWHGRKLTKEEWKDVFTATLKGQTVVPNLDGTGFIAVGGRTSTMSKTLFCDLITLIYAFGDQRGVAWSDPKYDSEDLWRR